MPVLFGSELPERHQLRQIVIATFDCILIHQPPDADSRELRSPRQQTRADRVVATRVVPEIWNHSSCDHAVSTRLLPRGPQLEWFQKFGNVRMRSVPTSTSG